jgi:hypothetical protein
VKKRHSKISEINRELLNTCVQGSTNIFRWFCQASARNWLVCSCTGFVQTNLWILTKSQNALSKTFGILDFLLKSLEALRCNNSQRDCTWQSNYSIIFLMFSHRNPRKRSDREKHRIPRHLVRQILISWNYLLQSKLSHSIGGSDNLIFDQNLKQVLFTTVVSESKFFKISVSEKGLANISRAETQNNFAFIADESHYPPFLV